MKKQIASILFLLIVQRITAENFYDQLCAFNSNWKKYSSQAPMIGARYFHTDAEYVQAHLGCVIPILMSNPVDQLDESQIESRHSMIQLLDEYRLAGNFPINKGRQERIPVFIDDNDTHCAVGYLLQQTGHEELARKISAIDNYAWVKDIHLAELIQWQETSGLTIEELKLIQGAYDSYHENAFIAVNKYELPQKPGNFIAYFESEETGRGGSEGERHVWCKGEGKNGHLNGRWEQNYSSELPWIVGFYENDKRTGQWMEYYQGTNNLCRTENWRNDKLNGIRKRFDRQGKLIEEIQFKDGKAVCKTNYDLENSLTWIRTPIDSVKVYTEVYTTTGSLLATGHERIFNPGNLMWFQNIELTALNSAAITARDNSFSAGGFIRHDSRSPYSITHSLYNTPPLVEYKKEGEWIYYKEYGSENAISKTEATFTNYIAQNYPHLSSTLLIDLPVFDVKTPCDYDSVHVQYSDNMLMHFFGYHLEDCVHYAVTYHQVRAEPYLILFDNWSNQTLARPRIKSYGSYNSEHCRIGEWKHFDESGLLYKIEKFILPERKDELVRE